MHEVGHSLGMWHEHSRPDRDDYVQVMWDNVLEGKEANFLKKSWKNTEVHGIGYDLDSIMHYPSWVSSWFIYLLIVFIYLLHLPRVDPV